MRTGEGLASWVYAEAWGAAYCPTFVPQSLGGRQGVHICRGGLRGTRGLRGDSGLLLLLETALPLGDLRL